MIISRTDYILFVIIAAVDCNKSIISNTYSIPIVDVRNHLGASFDVLHAIGKIVILAKQHY